MPQFAGFLYVDDRGRPVIYTMLRAAVPAKEVVYLDDEEKASVQKMSEQEQLELYLSTAEKANEKAVTRYLSITPIGSQMVALYTDAVDGMDKFWEIGGDYWVSLADDIEEIQQKMGFGTFWILNPVAAALDFFAGIAKSKPASVSDQEELLKTAVGELDDILKYLKKHKLI